MTKVTEKLEELRFEQLKAYYLVDSHYIRLQGVLAEEMAYLWPHEVACLGWSIGDAKDFQRDQRWQTVHLQDTG